jgi:hypothetical protein
LAHSSRTNLNGARLLMPYSRHYSTKDFRAS